MLACDNVAPLTEAALRSIQVMSTLISVATHLMDTRNGYTGCTGYDPNGAMVGFSQGQRGTFILHITEDVLVYFWSILFQLLQ